MNEREFIQVGLYLGTLLALTPLLGRFMARVFSGQRTVLSPVLEPLERLIYRCAGIDPAREMTWPVYAAALLAFHGLGFLVLLVLLMTQSWLPLNPANVPNVSFPLAFNTAVSFVTNTNWQAYSGEATLSYLTQMAGLGVQNFVSAGVGMAVLIALARGLRGKSADAGVLSTGSLGNFWVDLTRSVLYVLLPLSIALSLALVSEGVVQSFAPYAQATTLEGAAEIIPLGPAASQVAIKQLGTNGGGFFGVNSAHPFENPTPFSNFLQMLAILLIPSALTYTYGILIGDRRHGWAIWAAMTVLFVAGLAVALIAELQPNPVTGLSQSLEGKEQRFGVVNSVLWGVATTAASNGSVNAMHDSFSPLAGLVTLINMQLGEVVFGGVGAGLYGMLMFVVLTVFIAGLMVGRTPEYLGKKIDATEIRWAVVAVLAPCVVILLGTALAVSCEWGLAGLTNQGPHGLSEILYAFSSAAGNNGSAFAGLGVNTNFYNFTLGAAILIGRFAIILPVLAIAGSMATKKVAPPSAGTFPTNGVLFSALLVGVVLIVGALTFLPVLSLGPIIEHFLVRSGTAF